MTGNLFDGNISQKYFVYVCATNHCNIYAISAGFRYGIHFCKETIFRESESRVETISITHSRFSDASQNLRFLYPKNISKVMIVIHHRKVLA